MDSYRKIPNTTMDSSLGDYWDDDLMLGRYVYDYLVKKNMLETAEIFKFEAGLDELIPVSINDSSEGFLSEWWTIFYERFKDIEAMQPAARRQEESANAKGKQVAVENQQVNMLAVVPFVSVNHQRPGENTLTIVPVVFGNYQRPGENTLAVVPAVSGNYQRPGENTLAVVPVQRPGEFPPSTEIGNRGRKSVKSGSSVSRFSPKFADTSYQGGQQKSNWLQLQASAAKEGVNMGQIEPTARTMEKSLPSIAERQDSGKNKVAKTMQPTRWPWNYQANNAAASVHHQQFQLLTAQGQLCLMPPPFQALKNVNSNPGTSANFNIHGTDDTQQMTTQKVMAGMKHATELQNQMAQHQCVEDTRNKKAVSQPGAEDGNDKAVEVNVLSFLENDYDTIDAARNPTDVLNRYYSGLYNNDKKAITIQEIGCLKTSKQKVFCCNFSSNGRFLASAGHEKKVSIWNMENFEFVTSTEGHSLLVTDIVFSPNSSLFATSSFDKTVKIWDSNRPASSQMTFSGHVEQVTSLDFHPRKNHILCSSDTNNEIRFWNLKTLRCIRTSKGATKMVRFQPPFGNLLATAAGNHINIIDFETDKLLHSLEGHSGEVLSICWDPSGRYIASVSEDAARLWTVEPRTKCVKEIKSYGNKFRSCTFHPGHSPLVVVGAYQTLELWKPTESNQTTSIQAHNGVITSVVNSVEKGMVASASHDQCVKIWK